VEEMKAFKEAGLSNYKVLEAATMSAAKYLHAEKEWGTVEKGKCANCILLARNPLEDITAVSEVKGVFLDKDFYSEQELKAKLN
jgi:imidazolonepropionase-like amidohydrolase